MNQESMSVSSIKPERGMFWIVGTIWANIFIVFLIALLIAVLLSLFLGGLIINPILVSVFTLLLYWGVIIFAIRLGVKSVLAKSVIKKEKILKISVSTGFVFFLLAFTFLFLIYRTEASILSNLVLMVSVLVISAIYTSITYFWCKRLVK